jgi:hypothetical protein
VCCLLVPGIVVEGTAVLLARLGVPAVWWHLATRTKSFHPWNAFMHCPAALSSASYDEEVCVLCSGSLSQVL